MKLSPFSKRRGILLIILGIVIIAGLVTFYFVNRPPANQPVIQTPAVTAVVASPTATAASTSTSPISPISPVNPAAGRPTSAPPDEEAIQAMIERGLQLQQSGEYEAAIETFDEIIALAPDNIIAHNARGSVYAALGDYEQAYDDYSQAIAIEPFFPAAYYNRGRLAYNVFKKYDEALADLQRAIDLAPKEFGYRANGNIGLIYHQLGEYDKALAAFDESISYDDTKADVFFFRGETYTALENYEAAITNYQAAIDRFNDYELAYQGLGYAYYKTGQFDQALAALNQALEISPDSPTPHLYLMLVYLATDDLDRAQTAASQATNSIDSLPAEKQQAVLSTVLADLEAFAQDNPAKAKEVEALIDLIKL